jgi:hypothetical protein
LDDGILKLEIENLFILDRHRTKAARGNKEKHSLGILQDKQICLFVIYILLKVFLVQTGQITFCWSSVYHIHGIN